MSGIFGSGLGLDPNMPLFMAPSKSGTCEPGYEPSRAPGASPTSMPLNCLLVKEQQSVPPKNVSITAPPTCPSPVNTNGMQGDCGPNCYYFCPTKSCIPSGISTPAILPGACDDSLPLLAKACLLKLPGFGCVSSKQAMIGGGIALALIAAVGIYAATRN